MLPKTRSIVCWTLPQAEKCTFGSASIDLPNLHLLIISGASELEEFVGCGQGKGDELGKTKLELPRLKLLIFTHLSSLGQETELPNLKNCFIYKCPKLSLISTTTLGELGENFPFEDFINTNLFDVYDFMRCLDEDYDSSEFTSSQEIGNVGNKSIEEGPAKEGDKTKPLSSGVEDISTGGGVATHIESGGMDILAQVSKVVEQDAFADIRARLGAYKHFVDMDDAQIALPVEAITTYPHLWNASEKFSSWVDEMRQRVMVGDPKLREEIARRQMDENPKRSSIVEMVQDSRTIEHGDGPNENRKRTSSSVKTRMLIVTSKKALVDKQRINEPCWMNQQKPLGEIVSSPKAPRLETNNIRLLSVLNFLSNLPFKDVTLSDGLKDVIGIMQQEFPSIICSFKQGFATTEKLAKFEAREKEVAISLGSKISRQRIFMVKLNRRK
ncbi:hypothetical protein ACSQ67_005419 [Phaseolus vulgaris]